MSCESNNKSDGSVEDDERKFGDKSGCLNANRSSSLDGVSTSEERKSSLDIEFVTDVIIEHVRIVLRSQRQHMVQSLTMR